MKIVKLLVVLLVVSNSILAQSPAENLNKYWWHRYTLVNDYMKIGLYCGESIPGYRHYEAWDLPYPDDTKHMHWGDATIYLGQYMMVLATEYDILKRSNQRTRRTLEEMYLALKAFDRLDVNAEEMCRNFPSTMNCENINPQTSGPLYGFPANNDFNGFFIRDDVPLNFEVNNHKHFNRFGRCKDVDSEMSDVVNRIDGFVKHPNGGYSTWVSAYPNTPRYPVEMSQDQVAQIYSGLAMIVRLLDGSETYNNENLKVLAKGALLRVSTLVSWPGPGSWMISNPITGMCVYGTKPDLYDAMFLNSHCSQGGSYMFNSAVPLSLGLTRIGAGWNTSESQKVASLTSMAAPLNFVHQSLKYVVGKCNSNHTPSLGDQMLFMNTFAAFGKSYRLFFGANVTRQFINRNSVACDFRWPHLPLMYRIINGGDLFKPEDSKFGLKSYATLLDEAPRCKFNNYNGVFDVEEWSSPNRLAEPYKRGETGANGDFPGLSYMVLFNLFVLNDHNYLNHMNNPYYSEEFNHNWPLNVNGQIHGSHNNPYVYDSYEFLSTRSKILSDGQVVYRNGKTIELLPGFETENGALFLAYVKDYSCCGNNNVGVLPGDGEEIEDDPIIIDTLTGDTIVPFIIPEVDEDDYEASDAELFQDSISYLDSLYNSGDSAMISYVNDIIYGDTSTSENKPTNVDHLIVDNRVEVYPNPSQEVFNIKVLDDTHYNLKVYNSVGQHIITQDCYGTQCSLDLSDHSRGVYLLLIKSNSDGITRAVRLVLD